MWCISNTYYEYCCARTGFLLPAYTSKYMSQLWRAFNFLYTKRLMLRLCVSIVVLCLFLFQSHDSTGYGLLQTYLEVAYRILVRSIVVHARTRLTNTQSQLLAFLSDKQPTTYGMNMRHFLCKCVRLEHLHTLVVSIAGTELKPSLVVQTSSYLITSWLTLGFWLYQVLILILPYYTVHGIVKGLTMW